MALMASQICSGNLPSASSSSGSWSELVVFIMSPAEPAEHEFVLFVVFTNQWSRISRFFQPSSFQSQFHDITDKCNDYCFTCYFIIEDHPSQFLSQLIQPIFFNITVEAVAI